jgi:hypothetical protein
MKTIRKAFSARSLEKKMRAIYAGSVGILAFVLLVMSAAPARAQFRTSIQGVVTDPTGAVIPGATLTLKNNATNETITRTSDNAGVFNFNALPAASFTLTASRDGFQQKTLSNLQLIPEQPNSISVQLAIAGTTQQVTVDASTAPAIDTETANTGGTISANDFAHMPSWNRDPFTLTQLVPGMINDGAQSAGGGVYTPPGIGSNARGSTNLGAAPTENGPPVFANGGQMQNNGIMIDGISTSSAVWGGSTIITPDVDSVDNVRVLSNNYDAENGRYSGAQTMVTSKSGSNDLHGSAFLGIHRPGLNAYQGTIVAPNITTTPLRDTGRFNQYGGSLGGPFWKNRVFAFFDFESAPNETTATTTGWYDTPDFDKLGPSNSISSTYLTFPGAAVVSQSIVAASCSTIGLVEGSTCNTIPGQGLNIGSPLTTPRGTHDPTATGTPQNPGVGSGLSNVPDIAEYVTASPLSSYYQDFNGRVDANVTQRDHLAFAIYWVPQGQTSYQGGARAYNLFHHDQVNDAFSLIWNHTFSPTFLNEARANAAGWRWNEISDNPQSPVGLPQDNIVSFGSSSNPVTLNQFGSALGSILNQWTYGYKDVATKIAGRHTIKFGGDYTNLHYLNDPIGRPIYTFYNVWDFLNDAPELEQGNFDTVTGFPGGVRQDYRENLFGAFIQDDWKVLPNLTLHAGVRYSYLGPLYTKQDNLSTAATGSGSDYYTGIGVRIGGNLWTAQKLNFGPQIAFDWSPASFPNLVVRGGYGLNFNQEEIAITANANANPPTQGFYNFGYDSPGNPGVNGNDIVYGISSSPTDLNGFASNPNTITAYNSSNLPVTGNASVFFFGDGHGGLPTQYTHHFSLDVQYAFRNWLVASLGYQGSVGKHLMVQYQGNATALAQGGQALNPLVTNLNYYGNEGSSNNNAMLAELKHPFSHHFSVDAQFMWARSMDDTSQPYEEDPYYPDNPMYSRGRSDYDIRDSFKVFGLWQPVLFHGAHNWLEKAVGGWSLSGIFNIHTGFGWTPTYGISQSLYCSNCGYTTLRPQYLGGGGNSTSNKAFEQGSNFADILTSQSTTTATINGTAGTTVAYSNKYFSVPNFGAAMTGAFPNPNAALPPPPGIGRNTFNGPGYKDVDASLSKAFGLPENRVWGKAAALEVRADAFNLFNITNLNPSNIATSITATNFGQDTTPLGSRTISFEAHFRF